MTGKKIKGNLFDAPEGYYLVHCISGDYALGAGIAKQFDQIYNMREKLLQYFPIPKTQKFANVGKALLVYNVFNLVTKNRYYSKPTYESLEKTLVNMKKQCIKRDIKKLAMPLIGCGLDRLEWSNVRKIICKVFNDTDIDILIYVL